MNDQPIDPAEPVFEVGFGWLVDAVRYPRGTLLYAEAPKRRREDAAEPAVPAGWQVVPVEPTLDMTDAARKHRDYSLDKIYRIWAAMLAAAPKGP